MDFIGYSKEHAAYIFNDIAIANGKVIPINDEDYFKIDKLNLKSVDHSVRLLIETKSKHYTEEWVSLIWDCFGAKGIMVLTYWFGSLFAEQIRQHFKSYPFLQFIGEPGAGKSTLLEFLWQLFGREDYEGITPNEATKIGLGRSLGQVSGLPCCFIESDRDSGGANRTNIESFNFERFKSLYNGRPIRTGGVKNHSNQTYEPRFRGAVVFSQNDPIQASRAINSRLVEVILMSSRHSEETREKAQRLSSLSVEQVSHFLIKSCMAEKSIMDTVKQKTRAYQNTLLAEHDIKMDRIAFCHGQLLALLDALANVINLSDEMVTQTKQEIIAAAQDREKKLDGEHSLVVEFWEQMEYLNEEYFKRWGKGLNHSKNPSLIAVNLYEYKNVAGDYKQDALPIHDLRDILKKSVKREFVGNKAVASIETGKTKKCMVFKALPNDSLTSIKENRHA